MFNLENKYVRINNHEELDCLFEYANKHGWRWGNDGSELNTSTFGDGIAYPFIMCFKNKKVYWNTCNSNTDFKDIEKYLKPEKEIEKEMTAREFLRKFIKQTNCTSRLCEACKFFDGNNKLCVKLCESSTWRKEYIDYLIELVSNDDPIYHPPMDNITAANFIDNVLGGKDLSKEEEKALKYAAEKLREIG